VDWRSSLHRERAPEEATALLIVDLDKHIGNATAGS
jgi:hypothetical protein